MGCKAEEIVKEAISYLGTIEGDAQHHDIIDRYNTNGILPRGYKVKYTDAWCAAFVSTVAINCHATDIIPKECGAEEMYHLCKIMGITHESTPKEGDLVFYCFNNANRRNHVGFVVKVNVDEIEVVEGNKSDSVSTRKILWNDERITEFARPRYTSNSILENQLEIVAKNVIAGKFGNGDERKKRLNEAGYEYNQVQAVVNKMLRK